MAKYYVQCASNELVIESLSPTNAALSLADRLFETHKWIYLDETLTGRDCLNHLMFESLLLLESSIRISERGFNRDDAIEIGTPELVQLWHHLSLMETSKV